MIAPSVMQVAGGSAVAVGSQFAVTPHISYPVQTGVPERKMMVAPPPLKPVP